MCVRHASDTFSSAARTRGPSLMKALGQTMSPVPACPKKGH